MCALKKGGGRKQNKKEHRASTNICKQSAPDVPSTIMDTESPRPRSISSHSPRGSETSDRTSSVSQTVSVSGASFEVFFGRRFFRDRTRERFRSNVNLKPQAVQSRMKILERVGTSWYFFWGTCDNSHVVRNTDVCKPRLLGKDTPSFEQLKWLLDGEGNFDIL